MQGQLGDNGIERSGSGAHFRQGAQFADQQGIGAGKVDQEQIILRQVAAKSGFRQRTGGQLLNKGVCHIVLPVTAGQLAQFAVKTVIE